MRQRKKKKNWKKRGIFGGEAHGDVSDGVWVLRLEMKQTEMKEKRSVEVDLQKRKRKMMVVMLMQKEMNAFEEESKAAFQTSSDLEEVC